MIMCYDIIHCLTVVLQKTHLYLRTCLYNLIFVNAKDTFLSSSDLALALYKKLNSALIKLSSNSH